MVNDAHTSLEKALAVNLDSARYGSFAEIGAGQEVVRWFFQAGGAAGTIAKSISAYDMKVSDAIYGSCSRYVCRERLEAMLDLEQALNRQRLSATRGADTGFFCFADTVSARNFHGTNECHGWLGMRFQRHPGAEDSTIVIHVRMLDVENAQQQDALGILGVNLVYGAFYLSQQPEQLVESLLDNLSTDRIEVDMIEFGGAGFEGIDNRIMSLKLVQLGLSGAAMFAADGRVLQPSEVLRKRALVVERGRFRPVTYVNLDLMDSAIRTFEGSGRADVAGCLPIMEITMHNLQQDGAVCLDDFISRADVLATTGHVVMISDFFEYHRLAAYLCRYTNKPIGLAMGVGALSQLFAEKYYSDLDGGTLEGFGRLFKEQLMLLIYPNKAVDTGALQTLSEADIDPALTHLFAHLVNRGSIVAIDNICEQYLDIHSPDVLKRIASGDPRWESMVPEVVATTIKQRGLFGCRAQAKIA